MWNGNSRPLVATPLSNEIASFVKSKFEALVKKDEGKEGEGRNRRNMFFNWLAT